MSTSFRLLLVLLAGIIDFNKIIHLISAHYKKLRKKVAKTFGGE